MWSCSEELRAWRRERLPLALLLPGLALVGLAASAGRGIPSPAGLLAAALALSAWRLLDDLADLDLDRLRHPQRALPRARDLRPHRRALASALVLASALSAGQPALLAVLVGLSGGLGALYAAGAHRRAGGRALVLLKVPALALGLRAEADAVGLIAAGVLALAAAVDELDLAPRPAVLGLCAILLLALELATA